MKIVLLSFVLIVTSLGLCTGAPVPGIDFVNDLGMKMIWVGRGPFSMGTAVGHGNSRKNERPLHEVIVRNGFWIGKTEVTQKSYKRLLRSNPSRHRDPDCPVSSVHFEEAILFCQRLNDMEKNSGKVPEGYQYNLPTESQWEYAARTDRSGKDLLNDMLLSPAGWSSETVLFDGNRQSLHQQKVATSKANSRGIYDMCGNLWEWCLDNYHPDYGGTATDERVWLDGADDYEKVIRGGAYLSLPSDCTPVRRLSRSQTRDSQSQGFRIVLSVSSLYALSENKISESSKLLSQNLTNNINPSSKLTSERLQAVEEKVVKKIEPATISTNSLGMRMIWIPKGKVDDGTDLTGDVEAGFWMGACEVTQEEYEKLMGKNPSHFKREERPVENVSFGDAHRFCKALSKKENKIYRLPSIIEWKHALYAGGSNLVYGNLKDIAWTKAQSRGRIATKSVGDKSGNGYGLFDMIGNVAEWTDSILLQIKGFGKSSRKVSGFICSGGDMEELMKKTKAGCSINTRKADIKASMFSRANPGDSDKFTGFRVLCQLQTQPKPEPAIGPKAK